MRDTAYDIMQDMIKNFTQQIRNLSEEINSESIKRLASSIEEKIEKNAFYLVVLGQFKRGNRHS